MFIYLYSARQISFESNSLADDVIAFKKLRGSSLRSFCKEAPDILESQRRQERQGVGVSCKYKDFCCYICSFAARTMLLPSLRLRSAVL